MNFGNSEHIVRKEYFNFIIFHKNVLASDDIANKCFHKTFITWGK